MSTLVIAAHDFLAQGGPQGTSLEQFLSNARSWIFGILATLTATYLAIGCIRLVVAGGEPGQVAKAKEALKSAVHGFIGTMLSPAFVGILQSLVGSGR